VIFKNEEEKKYWEKELEKAKKKDDYVEYSILFANEFAKKCEEKIEKENIKKEDFENLSKVFEEVEKVTIKKYNELTGNQIYIAIAFSHLYLSWSYGEELLKWWNRRIVPNKEIADKATEEGKIANPLYWLFKFKLI